MVYRDRFIAVVKSGGRILRNMGGVVTLPFGSEYTIFMRNQESRRAQVKVSVDGQDALDGKAIIIPANGSHELGGFMRGTAERFGFKFVQKTKEIAENRGDFIDDGMIRVEFAFEKPAPVINFHWNWPPYQPPIYHHHHHRHLNPWLNGQTYDTGGTTYTGNTGDVSADYSGMKSRTIDCSFTPTAAPVEDEGITVAGSDRYVQYQTAHIGRLEQSHVIVIRLRGTTETGTLVSQPVTTRDRLKCSVCGYKSRSHNQFCGRCGCNLSA